MFSKFKYNFLNIFKLKKIIFIRWCGLFKKWICLDTWLEIKEHGKIFVRAIRNTYITFTFMIENTLNIKY